MTINVNAVSPKKITASVLFFILFTIAAAGCAKQNQTSAYAEAAAALAKGKTGKAVEIASKNAAQKPEFAEIFRLAAVKTLRELFVSGSDKLREQIVLTAIELKDDALAEELKSAEAQIGKKGYYQQAYEAREYGKIFNDREPSEKGSGFDFLLRALPISPAPMISPEPSEIISLNRLYDKALASGIPSNLLEDFLKSSPLNLRFALAKKLADEPDERFYEWASVLSRDKNDNVAKKAVSAFAFYSYPRSFAGLGAVAADSTLDGGRRAYASAAILILLKKNAQ